MGLFDKFFGVVPPSAGTPVLAGLYALIGLAFTILSFGRWIMPHAELDLSLPWAIVSLLLLATGAYGVWATTKGSTWHHRQFVSASWGFLLMFLCWAIVYIAVEDHHIEKVNKGCAELNPDWAEGECDSKRKKAVTLATALVTVGMVLGFYFTLVVSKWVSGLEWEEHLEEERRLDQWRSGHAEAVVEIKA
ncbi:hypothetical protein BGZ51_000847 [Haplosporangium sp. Z 767]|nr:hypothetical protein BGZ50_002291 [Haplosporangium sp. Z 11]KAF9188130.1 hypothetical protein BGZ51_000847 [Haplosporangium sp. Z 767]